MKKLLLLFLVLVTSVAAFSQGTPFPNYQPQGSPTTRWSQQGAVQGVKGLINGIYTDTSAANIGYIDYYPGAQIFTYKPASLDSGTVWVRNHNATKWLRGSGSIDITSFTFDNDTTGTICFGNGTCVTFDINDFDSSIINIVNNNFTTTSTYLDSGIIICTGTGSAQVCDTFFFGIDSIVNIFPINDSQYVACDTPQVIQVGDEYTTQQICDTITVPRNKLYQFVNGVQESSPGIVVHGTNMAVDQNKGQLVYDTYLNTVYSNYTISGQPILKPPLSVINVQDAPISASAMSIKHNNGAPLGVPNNTVGLYINRFDPFVLEGDNYGFMGLSKGYAIMNNAQGSWYSLAMDNNVSKQSGLFIHDRDTANNDAVSIFGQQVPSAYLYGNNPPADSNFYSKRIAVFKNEGTVQFPYYPDTRNDGVSPSGKGFYADADGNLKYGAIGGGGSGSVVTILSDSTIEVCNGSVCDTFDIGTPITNLQNVFVINDTTLRVCNVDNTTCDTVYLSTPVVFSLGITANNGLTANLPTNVQWGAAAAGSNSPLLHATFINTGGFLTTFTGSNAGYIAAFTNSGAGNGVTVTSTGEAVRGTSTNSFGVVGLSTNSTGVAALSFTATGSTVESRGSNVNQPVLWVTADVTSANNSVHNLLQINRLVSAGNGASGIGASINWAIDDDAGQENAAKMIVKWVDATHATNKSQVDIQAVSSGAMNTIMSAYGTGVVGIGISSGYTASRLHIVDNSATGALTRITSTSTAATTNAHRGLDIVMSGANINSSITTAGIVVDNTHTGTGSINYGAIFNASGGGTNVGVGSSITGTGNSAAFYGANNGAGKVAWFQATTTGNAVYAEGASGTTIVATSNSGIALYGLGNGTANAGTLINGGGGLALGASSSYTSLNTAESVVKFSRGSGSTPAADGIGGIIDLEALHITGTSIANQIIWKWTTAAIATRTSSLTFTGVLSASTVDLLTLAGDGSVKLRPITATAASAITPAEGMLLIVNSTDGTFTSTGFWGYSGGAWGKLTN